MTHANGGYPPHRDESQSTPQAAKQEAAEVARTAAERGGQVGTTAAEQARRVASETTRQARDLMAEGRNQLVEQAKQGQSRAAGGLHTLADQLRDMADKTDSDGVAPEMVRQAAERTRNVATWLDEREPGTLLDEVRSFARRRPGVFLTGAALAGVLVGRLTRGAVAAASDESDTGTNREPTDRTTTAAAPPVTTAAYGESLPGTTSGQPVTAPATPSYSVPPSQAPGTQMPSQYPGQVTR